MRWLWVTVALLTFVAWPATRALGRASSGEQGTADPEPAWHFRWDPGHLELGVNPTSQVWFSTLWFSDQVSWLRWGAGTSGAIRYGWIEGTQGRAAFLIGSRPVQWGPSSVGGLVFSEHAGPFERLEASITWNKLKLTRFVGWLDQNRSVVATRLDVRVRPNFRVGFGEAIIMDGPIYAGYLAHPIPWLLNYYLVNKVRAPAGKDDNYVMSLDFEWFPRSGLRMFGEVLIDDFTVPMNNANFPSRWGLSLGSDFVLARKGLNASIQYTIVPNWTYSTGANSPQYVLRGNPLGHPLGADFDLLHVRLAPSGQRFPATWWVSFIRKGEGEVGRIWTDEAEARAYPFLRGIVQYTTILGVDVPFNGSGWGGKVKPWVAYRSNAGHHTGNTRIDWGIGISAARSY